MIRSEDFSYICDLVRRRSAIALAPGKEYLVESRLRSLARQEGFPSLRHMVDCMRSKSSDDLHRKVVEAMATNETSFFREIRVFDMFRKAILPRLIAARERERSLNLWCAASSTGQEPYSIAMLLHEHFPMLAGWNITLIASDISQEILARAKSGLYNQLEVNRGLPASLLVRHFKQQGTMWEISADIRRMVEFRELNLIHDWPFLPRMDVIFLRNVLIYMDLEMKKTILLRTRQMLKPDGYVLLGGAETTSNIDDAFEPTAFEGATCFQLRTRVPREVPAMLRTVKFPGKPTE